VTDLRTLIETSRAPATPPQHRYCDTVRRDPRWLRALYWFRSWQFVADLLGGALIILVFLLFWSVTP
jgi:hypothetical protein